MSRVAMPGWVRVGCTGALAGLALAGCFYTADINQRPAVSIVPASSEPAYRGGLVMYKAEELDPDGDAVSFSWRAYACTDALDFSSCDQDPFDDPRVRTAQFAIPNLRADNVTPVRSLWIVLEAEDDRGATAKPRAELVVPVLNRPPVVQLRSSRSYAPVVGSPIEVYADVSDPDDGAAAVAPVVWELFSPAGAQPVPLDELTVAQPTNTQVRRYAKVFTPLDTGTWTVRVTATDPAGDTFTHPGAALAVGVDSPPCLEELHPIVAPAGTALPLTEPTLFQVPIVLDDLDPYPTVPDDDVLGTPTFAWSVKTPADATHVAIPDATSSGFALDPASFTPGDIIQLRVEIDDRNQRGIPCADAPLTCSISAVPSCLQRQTWRLEIR